MYKPLTLSFNCFIWDLRRQLWINAIQKNAVKAFNKHTFVLLKSSLIWNPKYDFTNFLPSSQFPGLGCTLFLELLFLLNNWAANKSAAEFGLGLTANAFYTARVHNSDSNSASSPISEMVTSHRGDTLVWQGLKYRQCPIPIAHLPRPTMPVNEAWPNISSHLHTQHPSSSSACTGAVNNLCISITEGTWVATSWTLGGGHATDIFLAEHAIYFSQ